MCRDHYLPRNAALRLGLVLGALTGLAAGAQGQASTVSALAGTSLVPAGPAGGAPTGFVPAVRVGEAAAAPDGGGPVASGVTSLTPAEAAAMMRSQPGRGTMVIFYGTACSRSKGMFPGFTALAARHAGRDVSFLAFAVREEAQDVPPFLAEYGAPFQPYFVKRGSRAQFGQDMDASGLRLPQDFNLPHVAVFDGSGNVVGQWDAATDLRAMDATLAALP